jgi:aminomuconate-semialdehyde/2-hydroxymuconate-6-semialdehyde dehydrogenase
MTQNPIIQNYIGGKWQAPRSGQYIDLYEPATGKVYAQVPSSNSEDISEAVDAASRAFVYWSKTSVVERSRVLLKIAEGIERELEPLALAESIDTGKPLSLAQNLDIPRAAQNFSFFAEQILKLPKESHVMEGVAINHTLRDPLGVVACISPWNLPLYLFTWKIAPALASGCTVVAKPSEVTPMTAYLLSRIAAAAGLPPGVLNIVHGNGPIAGSALVSHPKIKAVSFTGSTKTGADIARVTGPSFKKLSLEMGGKNAAVVFADCSFENTIAGVLRSAFTNQGQVCLCGSRIFVERSIYGRFKDALVKRTLELKQGDPLSAGTDQGAVVSKEHFEKVMSHIRIARDEGGTILTGGEPIQITGRCSEGWFIQPTLIEGLAPSCRTNQEEIFGPVATLIPFDHEDEVIRDANGTRYGLSASIWSENPERSLRVASALEAGVVWVNCWLVRDLRTPFGGMKDSGVGREGGIEALNFFSELKNVCIRTGN